MKVSAKITLSFVIVALVTLIIAGGSFFIMDKIGSGFGTVTVVIFAAVLSVAVAIVLGSFTSRMVFKPLTLLAAFMEKAGTKGDLTLTQADKETIGQYMEGTDELSRTIQSCAGFVGRVTEVSKTLEAVAAGDLTVSLPLLSDSDTIGVSLKTMTSNLNNMFEEIKSAADQLDEGSKQIANGAQIFAQGSTEQAATIEELASSLHTMKDKTNTYANMTREAATLSNEIKSSAEKGSSQMSQMMQAVTEINEASGSIGRVIKVIDDIAFQTNILALNAAVEAARAGQHGKGFAVVAEEVRTLAAKSAEAAKDTGGLIENSIEKANLGLSMATETSASLQSIVEGINRNADIIAKMEDSSKQEASEIMMIDNGIDQVASVVQQNSATAQQSAAASEELSSQSAILKQLISQFKLKGAKSGLQRSQPAAPPQMSQAPPRAEKRSKQAGPSFTPREVKPRNTAPPEAFPDDFGTVNDKY